MTGLCVSVVIKIFLISQVLAAPVADAKADAKPCFFGDYGDYGNYGPNQQNPPQVIIIGPGNNIPGTGIGGNPPGTGIGGNPPGTGIGGRPPGNIFDPSLPIIIFNRNAVQSGSNNRNPLETIVQSDLNPGTGPLYYSDYGI